MPEPSTETIYSYGGLFHSRSEIYYPASVPEIIEIYQRARAEGRRVAFHGNGYSFDTQGLDSGILISLARFDSIHVYTDARQVVVGAGAIWGDILAATEPHGLVPGVMVSTSYASAGGTMASCGMSRFSPTAGKEGKWIERFLIVTPDGSLRQCSRSENADLFYAAIGGYGYFGAVIEIAYRLLYVGTPAHIRTHVTLKPHSRDLHLDLLPQPQQGPDSTIYSAFAIAGDQILVMYCHTAYCNDAKLVPMMPHRPMINGRLITEFLVQWIPAMGQLFWRYAYHVYVRMNDTYIDPTPDYTFFMDGNVRAKRLGRKIGMRFRAIQQTYVIPLSEQLLNDFLKACIQGMKAAGAPPAMIDALCLPADEGFLLSSSRGMSGYAVSIAFASLSDAKIKNITQCLEQLTTLCREMGGRIHLTKNVFARPEDVQAMYADVLPALFATKDKYDPEGLIGNCFLERLFRS